MRAQESGKMRRAVRRVDVERLHWPHASANEKLLALDEA